MTCLVDVFVGGNGDLSDKSHVLGKVDLLVLVLVQLLEYLLNGLCIFLLCLRSSYWE